MLRIDRNGKMLKRLEERTMGDAGLQERYDIQQMIRQSSEEFFAEMGEELLLIGEEIRPADFVDDRMDLLAVDKQGASVIVELKRASHKLQLLQALAYAAMVSQWESSRIAQEYSATFTVAIEDSEERIEDFLEEDVGSLNESQRVILIAEAFDFDVLVTAEWLTDQYSLDIRCYRVSLSADGETEYLTCTCIYPPPEIKAHAKRRGRGLTAKPSRWATWQEVYSSIKNPAVAAFYKAEIAGGRENYLRHRNLRFRVNGKRRLFVSARTNNAYVWQAGRFESDEKFWRDAMGDNANVAPVKDGRCLRFYLTSEKDFTRFKAEFENRMPQVEFLEDDQIGADEGE